MALKKRILTHPKEYYTEVDLSAAEIATLGSVPVDLTLVSDSNKYYIPSKIIVEFTPGNSAYTCTVLDKLYIQQDASYVCFNIQTMLEYTDPLVYVFHGFHGGGIDLVEGALNGYGFPTGNKLTMALSNNPLVAGDGTMKIKIWYSIHTFG